MVLSVGWGVVFIVLLSGLFFGVFTWKREAIFHPPRFRGFFGLVSKAVSKKELSFPPLPRELMETMIREALKASLTFFLVSLVFYSYRVGNERVFTQLFHG
jgi:hypothetical protein